MNKIFTLKEDTQSWKSFFLELALLLAVVLLIRTYVFQFFRISGPSMCPTLNVINDECLMDKGEFVFVNQFVYKFLRNPQRGEIVVFYPPKGKNHYIKRIIGTPGDIIVVKNGKVYRTNKSEDILAEELDEPYLSAKNQGHTQSFGQEVFEVPKGKYFLMGDNRTQSLDSRQCFSGGRHCDGNPESAFIPKGKINGVAEFVAWPFWQFRTLNAPTGQVDAYANDQ